jgi:hypothetical protein
MIITIFFSGKGGQIAFSFWWLTLTHWENEKTCGLNLGHWTEWNEVVNAGREDEVYT